MQKGAFLDFQTRFQRCQEFESQLAKAWNNHAEYPEEKTLQTLERQTEKVETDFSEILSLPQMEPLFAKIGFDTAENEPCEVLLPLRLHDLSLAHIKDDDNDVFLNRSSLSVYHHYRT